MLLRERLCAGYGPLPPWMRFGDAPVIDTTLKRCNFNAALPRVSVLMIPIAEYQCRARYRKILRGRVKTPVLLPGLLIAVIGFFVCREGEK